MKTKISPGQSLEDLLQVKEGLGAQKAKEKCLKALEVVYKSRYMDDKMSKLVRQNKGGTFHMNSLGHELVGSVCSLSLTQKKDWGLPYYRDRSFALGLGCSMKELFGTFLGRATEHHSKGRMMPEHFSDKNLRIPVQSSVVGSQFLHAVGLAKGLKLSNKNEAVYVSAGEGATSQGDFHEALNFSCLHELGVIFVIQDNGWAISVPVEEQTAGGNIAKIAKGYEGLSVFEVDGGDYTKISKAMTEAVNKARNFEGPSLIVAKIPRLGPHSSSDDPKKYKDLDQIEKEQELDPILRFESWLLDMGLLEKDQLDVLKLEWQSQVEAAAKEAEKLPFPEKETVKDHVFKSFKINKAFCTKRDPQESIVMVDSINHALHEEMAKDSSIIVFGQDVAGGKGGVFGATRGLTQSFGKERCFNSPLAESTIIGAAIGMSFDGVHKPVVEIQFADYLWTGINQLFNELSSIHYRSAGEWHCPLVIRMPTGGYIQGGPYHSQSIEGFLAHCPGLKIVMPSNAEDAKRLLKAAILDPNPVIFLEHKGLYRQRAFSARPEPYSDEVETLGKAKVLKEGDDLTLVTWGMTAVMGFEIAEKLEKDGISVEVVDLRSISPVDFETILTSVKKTGKVLVAHEAPKHCGFGAEIAATLSEQAFTYLDAPIERIGSANSAVPYSKILEDAHLPQKSDLEKAMRNLASY